MNQIRSEISKEERKSNFQTNLKSCFSFFLNEKSSEREELEEK